MGRPANPSLLRFQRSSSRRPRYYSQAFLIFSRDLNNTYLQDAITQSCSVNDTRPQCFNQFGGLFDEGASSTWVSTNYTALDTAAECCAGQIDDAWGTDIVTLNANMSLPGFPLGIIRGRQDPMNTLGFGLNSTLITRLMTIGAVSSNTFGMFQGWTGELSQHQSDGGLTVGGYDASKIAGPNITLPMVKQDDCTTGLVVSISDINMNLKNGSNVSILGESQGSAMKACIDPNFTPITLSEDIWWAFENVTGVNDTGRSVNPTSYWAMTVPADGAWVIPDTRDWI